MLFSRTRGRLRAAFLAAAGYLLVSALPAWASGADDPVVPLLLALAVILGAGKLGGWLAVRVGQPAVLGELLFGIVLGNLTLLGWGAFEPMRHDPFLAVLSSLGVIVLLFEVGLESTVGQMLRVGPSSLLVALLGVVAPFALGWGVGIWLLPESSEYVHAFLGAVLTATSVGITARVLRDLNESRSDEAKIILGAAVIDDILGLIILAIVSGIITAADQGSTLSFGSIAWITAKAFGFVAVAIGVGAAIAPIALRLAARIRVPGILLTSGLVFCFLLSYLAAMVGLAPIVGAFAAGLVLEAAFFDGFDEMRHTSLEALLHPISTFLVPIFFVLTGLRVDLSVFGDARILGLAGALIAVAWIGKQACMFGVLQKGVDRLTVGLGMVPRGEVGLIFASIGASLTIAGERVVTPATYAAVVIMVIVTTLVTPPALQWSLKRVRGRAGASKGVS
ncbi:MAG TPA: cation:proton antiporter [Acidobacteriota bacterium]|nr:cation:proton antiporter [Acidobacteriota bacterium]